MENYPPYMITDKMLNYVSDIMKKIGEFNYFEGLNRYPNVDKCGLSLEINDLPDSTEGKFIRLREANYWEHPLDDKYFEACTDTTFALYRAGVNHYSYSAIRTNRPYTCKHIPWYYLDFESLSEEDKYYFNSANSSSSGKIRLCSK